MGFGKVVLLTGGAGYIGTHTVIALAEAGFSPIVLDNMANASPEALLRVEEIVGKKVPFYNLDLLDAPALREVFQKHQIGCVIHLAGLKAVGESCEKPLQYYSVNVGGVMNLLKVMEENGVRDLVFSSSATVYGTPAYLPIDEAHPVGNCTNPYGKTKYFIEEILKDTCKSNAEWNVVLLRYFNPVGAHESGRIGEDPRGTPNNLMPYVSQVAVGMRPFVSVYGSDFPTADGTGVRDYIHVMDLAEGHVAALRKLADKPGCKVYNLGTGVGYSVLDMIRGLEKAAKKEIPYKLVGRRPGDVPTVYANPSLAEKELGWKAKRDLDSMCEDLWRWQSNNPYGFSHEADEQ